MTVAEIERFDAEHGIPRSKHRRARIQKYVAKQRRKKQKRRR